MFQIDANNLPFVRTRQALLLLDLQNDFVAKDGVLVAENSPSFVDNILQVIPEFRASGNIIFVRSVFEASRPVNEDFGESENVITDKQLVAGSQRRKARRKPSRKHLKQNETPTESQSRSSDNGSTLPVEAESADTVEEAFLTVRPGQKVQAVLATSAGANLSDLVTVGMNPDVDLFFEKTWYSAFKDGSLVQTLRAKFVTEIYICGALSNISVYATAMDAARHGLAITIVEDCLGYRSKARHDEALKRLTEFTGCDIISSGELIEELRKKAQRNRVPAHNHSRPRPKETVSGLEGALGKLKLSESNHPSAPASQSIGTGSSVAVAEAEQVASVAVAESLSDDSTEQVFKVPKRPTPAGGKQRERVKTKIKTRRRNSRSVPKDIAVAGQVSSAEKVQAGKTTTTEPSQSKEGLPKHTATVNEPVPALETETSTITATSTNIKTSTKSQLGSSKLATDTRNTTRPIEADHSDLELVMENLAIGDGVVSICAGDTFIVNDLLKGELAEGIFEKIRDEVRWQKMSHQGGDVPRLVAVQGDVGEDGSIPIYRHPADESPPLLPFTQQVSLIKAEVERKLGHPVNHVLIQFYRDGLDYISEHSDKTLDIVPNTFIANVSLGAQRTMVFRTKRPLKNYDNPEPELMQPRQVFRAPLPHNSMCKMGLVTNMRWLHAIRQDKRMKSEKSPEELAYNGGRISLTFRAIGTYLDKDQQMIWGQGAVAKIKQDAKTVLNGQTTEAEKMLRAFGKENHSSEFDWNESYGEGFDVLHISNTRKLFLSGDEVSDLRVKLLLADHGIEWTEGKLSSSFNWKDGRTTSVDSPPVPESLPVKFVDNDLSKSTIVGDLAIMLYLDAVYGSQSPNSPKSQVDLARQFTRLQQAAELLKKWRTVPFNMKPFQREMEHWEAMATEAPFIAGTSISLADFAIWPVLHEIRHEWRNKEGLDNLVAYYYRLKRRDSFIKEVGTDDEQDGLKPTTKDIS